MSQSGSLFTASVPRRRHDDAVCRLVHDVIKRKFHYVSGQMFAINVSNQYFLQILDKTCKALRCPKYEVPTNYTCFFYVVVIRLFTDPVMRAKIVDDFDTDNFHE